jgi:hypothetical protein
MSNASFRKVSHLAGQMSDLNVSDLKANSLQVAQPVDANLGNYTRVTVVGYAPLGWNTAAVAASSVLLTSPQSALAADGSNALQLPPNALIELLQVNNNNNFLTVGAQTVTFALSNTAAMPVATPLGAITAAIPNAGINAATGAGPAIGSYIAAGLAPGAQALNPTAYSTLGGYVGLTGVFPMITQAGAANLTGDLCAKFTYLAANDAPL